MKKCWLYLDIFSCVKINVFSLSGSRCMQNAITSTKLEQTEEIFSDSRYNPAYENEMRGYLVYLLIVKYLSHWFCLHSATVNKIGRPYRGILVGWIFFFLEGSVDHIVYMWIGALLFTVVWPVPSAKAGTTWNYVVWTFVFPSFMWLEKPKTTTAPSKPPPPPLYHHQPAYHSIAAILCLVPKN